MTPFLKITLLVSLSFILHTSVMASAHDEDKKPHPWPPCLRTTTVNGTSFTQEELALAQDGQDPTRVEYRSGAKAMLLTMHGERITVDAFDPAKAPLWCADMKQRREAQEPDVWYHPNPESTSPVAMENVTHEGIVESLLFMRKNAPQRKEDRTVAGYLTRDISSTCTSKLVVLGVDQVVMFFRTPPPLSWISPNLFHMRLNEGCIQKTRTRGLAEKKDAYLLLTIPADKNRTLFLEIEGQDMRCGTPDTTFCKAWRQDIWKEVSAHTSEPQDSFKSGAFYQEKGLFFGSSHTNEEGKSVDHVVLRCKHELLSPVKRICIQRTLPDLEDTPLRISGYLDLETLTTKGLLVEGISSFAISLGRAVSLADDLD